MPTINQIHPKSVQIILESLTVSTPSSSFFFFFFFLPLAHDYSPQELTDGELPSLIINCGVNGKLEPGYFNLEARARNGTYLLLLLPPPRDPSPFLHTRDEHGDETPRENPFETAAFCIYVC